MSGLRRVIQAALGTPWAIQPEKLEAIAEVLAFQAAGGQLTSAEIVARIGNGKGAPQQGAGIAVLPLYGIVGHRMNQVQDISGPGGTSTEQFAAWFAAAMDDPAIGSIVLDVDSPGGTVQGVQELAQQIYDARGTKPILAISNSLAASAAYWIAAAADELWVIPSGEVGSIGVYAMHVDRSEADAEAGKKTTIISAGKFKVEGNPHEPLSDEARAAMQERVDSYYQDFTKAVAQFRGIDQDAVIGGYGEGRVLGARKAVREGMADKVGTLDTLLGKLGGGKSKGRLVASMLEPSPIAAVALDPMLESLGALRTHAVALRSLVLAPTADVAAAPVALPHVPTAPVAPKEILMPKPDEDAGTAAAAAVDPKVEAAAREHARVDGLLALAAEENVSATEVKRWKMEGVTVEAAQRELMAQLKAGANRRPALATHVSALDGGDNGTKFGPFRTLAENLDHIRMAGEGRVTPQLTAMMAMHAAATGASASVGADGGFLIQKDHELGLLESSFKSGEILSRCDTTELSANSDGLEVVYLDETDRATGSRWGGVQVFRVPEAPESVTSGKPQLGRWERRAEDIEGIAYMTERLLKDAPAMADVFSKGFSEEFKFVVENECWRGTGAGQGLGILSTASNLPTVTVAKDASQTSGSKTVIYENIQKMWRSVLPQARSRGAGFINVEGESELDSMMIGTGTSGTLVYMPPGGLSGSPYGSIKGRPVIPVEYASGVGTVGDIVFADWGAYKIITKGGVESDDSIHVRFIQRERVFRWVTRVNGAPKDASAIKPFKAADSTLRLSSFVALAAR